MTERDAMTGVRCAERDESRTSPRIGLALEGGGAKGAYAIGALRALQEYGVKVHVVSGTSVGALNALLFATEQLAEGQQYWMRLRLGAVARLRVGLLAFWFVLPFHVAGLILSTLPLPGSPPTNLRRQSPRDALEIAGGVMLTESVLCLLMRAIDPSSREPLYLWSALSALVLIWLAPALVRWRNWTALDPTPLSSVIERFLTSAARLLPTYICAAYRRLMLDPDRPAFMYFGHIAGVTKKATECEEFFPSYFRLDRTGQDERRSLLLASAALPLGIFPVVQVGDKEYIDGGVVDNLPIYPLVEREECDKVIVVALRPTIEGDLIRQWAEMDRKARLAALSNAEVWELYRKYTGVTYANSTWDPAFDPPEIVPLRDPQSWPHVLIIAPKKELGGFMTGTLRFSATYAARLEAQGYDDAVAALRNGHWIPPGGE